MGGDTPTVLVVEDEEALLDIYEQWLSGAYAVRTATSGRDALDQLDEDVDVVLLDRLMPGMSGDEVLSEIRAQPIDCYVAMVTAVEPDFDILEMGFDDYLTKPVEREELMDSIERLLARSSFAELERELYSIASKCAALQSAKTTDELETHEQYLALEARFQELRDELDATMPEVDSGEFVAMVRELDDARADSEQSSEGSAGGDAG